MDTLHAEITEYILNEFLPGEDPSVLTGDVELISGRILDSLATLKLVTFLEDTYKVQFEAHEVGIDNLNTIDRIVDVVREKQGQ
ncbi:MAG: acyl carrier protein [Calditrichaeota bacterium]|nr:acyl carrier protein [Candidatus Cloacimonadota bacterium]MCA9786710.1 acyl carrier protein [Candidatus Cloacimonadota bacterium]MCB1045878.1 acyl carrier protein [Calditrichota bacterium]MCB9472593.1 acyl carrier protein [Candidatus Delongbacteria bacterium]